MQKYSLLLLMSPECADGLASSLLDCAVTYTDTYDDALSALESVFPDAVIAEYRDDALALFEILHEVGIMRPVFVIVSESPLESPVYVDAIMPKYLLPSLMGGFLRMHAEKRQLYDKQQETHAENNRLLIELQRERKLKNEVEILKNAIVRNVSHELKTPLLQVKSAVALIAEDVADKKLIDYATGATARLETLVKNITMLGGSLEAQRGPVIVRDAVESARRSLRRVWESRDHTARVKLIMPPDLPPVFADKQGLSTVLQLLLDNALKFSKDDVEVSATLQGAEVAIVVRDYGIGIAKDQIEAIFDTFYQVDASSTRRYGGMGIGLAIVRLILDSHETQIHVESVVNEGSTFTFSLPIVKL